LFLTTDPSTPNRPLVKVLDFGISRLMHDSERLTTDFAQLGTALYMSPEQIESPSRVDERTDIWSLGVVLYEMIVGRPPFEGEGTGVLVSIATRPAPLPSTLLDDMPSGLEAVMMRALEKSPDARFQTMAAFARALAPWAPAGRAYRIRGSRMRLVLVAAVALVVVGGVVAIAAGMFDARSAVTRAMDAASASAAPEASASPSAMHSSSPTTSSRPPSAASAARRPPQLRGSSPAHGNAPPPKPTGTTTIRRH
jgi:serine/threonine protein kinase